MPNAAETFASRTRLLLGDRRLAKLTAAHVAVVGLGGVGGHAAEALARAGIGRLTLVDHDRVAISNLNRQILATADTLGQLKVEAMAARILSINPACQLDPRPDFLRPAAVADLLTVRPDYLLDCIDTVASKAALVTAAQGLGLPVASSMGAGGRLDATKVMVTTLAKTTVCPLARRLRLCLRKRGGSLDYPVVYSREPPHKDSLPDRSAVGSQARVPVALGTISYLPGLMGLMLAGVAIEHLLRGEDGHG